MENKEFIENLLRSRKLKATPQRLEVLTVFKAEETAIAYSDLQKKLNNFDRVTLYRTLQSLIEKGIVHKALAEDAETFYALCSSSCTAQNHNDKHIHFKCVNCDEVSCLHLPSPLQIEIPNHQIQKITLNVTGVCEKCN